MSPEQREALAIVMAREEAVEIWQGVVKEDTLIRTSHQDALFIRHEALRAAKAHARNLGVVITD